MEELVKKYEDMQYRLERTENLYKNGDITLIEKIERGGVIFTTFKEYLIENYPLHVLTSNEIVSVLREEKLNKYSYRIAEGTVEFPASEGPDLITIEKGQISDTLSAISYLDKLKDRISSYESELHLRQVLEKAEQFDTKKDKVDFLTDYLQGKDIEQTPRPELLKLDIIMETKKIEEQNESSYKPDYKLTIADDHISDFIELIGPLFESKIIIDKETKKSAHQNQIISLIQHAFNINLSNYHKLNKKALQTYKRAEEGKTFISKLLDIQKKIIQKYQDKEGLRKHNK